MPSSRKYPELDADLLNIKTNVPSPVQIQNTWWGSDCHATTSIRSSSVLASWNLDSTFTGYLLLWGWEVYNLKRLKTWLRNTMTHDNTILLQCATFTRNTLISQIWWQWIHRIKWTYNVGIWKILELDQSVSSTDANWIQSSYFLFRKFTLIDFVRKSMNLCNDNFDFVNSIIQPYMNMSVWLFF